MFPLVYRSCVFRAPTKWLRCVSAHVRLIPECADSVEVFFCTQAVSAFTTHALAKEAAYFRRKCLILLHFLHIFVMRLHIYGFFGKLLNFREDLVLGFPDDHFYPVTSMKHGCIDHSRTKRAQKQNKPASDGELDLQYLLLTMVRARKLVLIMHLRGIENPGA